MSASGVGGRREAHAFAAFVVSGGVAAGVNVVSRYVLSRWLTFEAAVAVAFVLAMTTAFLLNRAFVFRSSARWIGQYGRFAVVNLIAFVQVFLVSESLVRLLFPAVGLRWHPLEIGHLVGVMSPIVTSYYAHKHFTFRGPTDAQA